MIEGTTCRNRRRRVVVGQELAGTTFKSSAPVAG